MSMNVLSQGIDSNGKVAPMGATTTASGDPAGNVLLPDGLGSAQAGENFTYDAHGVVQGPFDYVIFNKANETVDLVIGANAGDYFAAVVVTVAIAGGPLDIYDGTVAAGTLLLSIPAGTALGTRFEFNIRTTAALTADDDVNTGGVVFTGIFS